MPQRKKCNDNFQHKDDQGWTFLNTKSIISIPDI